MLAVLQADVMGHNDKIELEIFRNQLGSGSQPHPERLKLLNGLLEAGERSIASGKRWDDLDRRGLI